MTALLSPKAWIAIVLAVALAFSHVFVYRAGKAAVRAEFNAYKLAAEQQAERQREANRGRAREVEERVVTQTVYRDRYITKTVKEIEHVTQPLASCPVGAPAVRLFNDAARCAGEDRPSACGADNGVQSPG